MSIRIVYVISYIALAIDLYMRGEGEYMGAWTMTRAFLCQLIRSGTVQYVQYIQCVQIVRCGVYSMYGAYSIYSMYSMRSMYTV